MASLGDMINNYWPGMPPPRPMWHAPPAQRNNWLILPPELVLHILGELIRVEELWALVCTSRLFWHLFRAHGAAILELVLADDTHPWLRNVIHATFNLQAGRDSPPWTYAELRHLDADVEREPLSDRASPALVRRFVTRARQIHAMAHLVLDRCMAELWALEDRLRPADPDDECPEVRWYLDRAANPGEETRAVMGLWLCELHFTLTEVAARQPWVARMFAAAPPAHRGILSFFRRTWHGTLLTLWHGILATRHSPDELERFHLDHGAVVPMRICVPRLPRGCLDAGFRCQTELPNYSTWDVHAMYEMAQMSGVMRARPLVPNFFAGLRAVAPRRDDPLHRLPGRAYLRFGVFHWDHDKIHCINLLPSGDYEREELFAYWKSLLPPALVEAYAAQQAAAKAAYWAEVDRLVARGEPVPEPQDYDDCGELYAEDPATEDEDEKEDEDEVEVETVDMEEGF